MLKKFITATVVGAAALVALTSCGSKASGTGEFATVYATATAPSSALDSDLVRWTDANGGAVSVCAAGLTPIIVARDEVNYTITATPYSTPNTGSTNPTVPSPLQITRIIMKLTPANTDTPALPERFQSPPLNSGQQILPGVPTPVPVEVVSTDLKQYLAEYLGLGTVCNNQTLTYLVTVSFEAKEISTDRISTITAPGPYFIHIGDFVAK